MPCRPAHTAALAVVLAMAAAVLAGCGAATPPRSTASQCGFTPQLEGLQALHREHPDAGLAVIGVPSGDSGGRSWTGTPTSRSSAS